MAIRIYWQWSIKPGRLNDYIALQKEARRTAQQEGVSHPVLVSHWQNMMGGQNTGRVNTAIDRDSMADIQTPSTGLQAILERITGPDGPASPPEISVVSNLEQAGDVDQAIAWSAVGHAKPGRTSEWMDHLANVNEMVLGAGASGIHHHQAMIGGPITGTLATVSYYSDLAAWAEASTKLRNDPDWQDLVSRVAGPDGPVEVTSQGLWRRLEI